MVRVHFTSTLCFTLLHESCKVEGCKFRFCTRPDRGTAVYAVLRILSRSRFRTLSKAAAPKTFIRRDRMAAPYHRKFAPNSLERRCETSFFPVISGGPFVRPRLDISSLSRVRAIGRELVSSRLTLNPSSDSIRIPILKSNCRINYIYFLAFAHLRALSVDFHEPSGSSSLQSWPSHREKVALYFHNDLHLNSSY